MIPERKIEEFEDDRKKWKIYFDIQPSGAMRGNSKILVSFVINREGLAYLTEKEMVKLKQDLKDLGKLRIIKQGREFLGSCEEVR